MVDKRIVEYVADLARISVSASEKDNLALQLSKIIDYIDKLKEVDNEGAEPLRGLHAQINVLREDKVESIFSKEDILNNAPERVDNYFKVPKVIE